MSTLFCLMEDREAASGCWGEELNQEISYTSGTSRSQIKYVSLGYDLKVEFLFLD